jgi:hypothetical protein
MSRASHPRQSPFATWGRLLIVGAAIGALAFVHVQCRTTPRTGDQLGAGSGYAALDEIIRGRSLSPDEAAAALKTFVPPGRHDDFLMVTSGGKAGARGIAAPPGY